MRKKVFLIISGLIILILILFGSTIKEFSPIFLQFIFNKDIELKKTNNAVNVLLLGIGGGVHEGPNLSDTIIFSSIKVTSQVALPNKDDKKETDKKPANIKTPPTPISKLARGTINKFAMMVTEDMTLK